MKETGKRSMQRLLHIRKAIDDIVKFTDNVEKDIFISDNLLSSAVLYQFNVIGEAIIYVDESILGKYNYPWHKVRSFRNLISHEYFNIKLDAVWGIIKNDLPELQSVIEKNTRKRVPIDYTD